MDKHLSAADTDCDPEIIESFGGPELYAHGAVIRPIDGPDVEIVFYVTRRRGTLAEHHEVTRMRMPLDGFGRSLDQAIAQWKGGRVKH